MPKMIALMIDGKQVSVPAGTLIVNAARQIGIDIPVFCYHPKMEPVGMCRQCLVEVGRPVIDRATGQPLMENGQVKIGFGPKLETACTVPVTEGMVVLSQSDKARASQKENLEFLLTSHPLDCPVCDKGGECPLQNLTVAHASPQSRYLFDEKHHAEKKVPLGELIWLDRERCIQCARCIRFQDEVAGDAVLAFYQRGRNTDIITRSEPGFDSIFSGNTTDICPVGALTSADFRFGARPWEMKAAASICPHCPVGCNVTINTRREAMSGGRVTIKRVMPRQNEAVNEIWMCDKGRFGVHFVEDDRRLVKPLVRKNGKLGSASWKEGLQTVAKALAAAKNNALILASGRLSNEDLFNLKQLAGHLGSEARIYTHMGGGALTASFGVPDGTNFSAMGKETTILVVASDLYNEAPLWFLRIKQAAERGATLIVASGRETKLERHAKFTLRYSYGDEAEAVAGLVKQKAIGDAISAAENLVVLYGSDGLGLEGSGAVAAACAGLVKDRRGKPNNGLIGVWPHANEQGAWELGFLPADDLAGLLEDKTVYLVAADPLGDDPHLEAALKSARFVAVQELFLTETAKLADVVLPAQAYTEREGTYTTGERRVQRFYPALPPRGEAWADYAITAAIGRELGLELEGNSPARLMDRLAASTGSFAGINYRKLAEVTEQWPIISRSDLYYGGTGYENRQGLGTQLALNAPIAIPSAAGKSLRPDENTLLSVPISRLYDRGITIFASEILHLRTGEAAVLLHPESAKKLGLVEGEQVMLGGFRVEVRLNATVPASVALLPRSMGLPVSGPAVAELKKA